MFETVMINSIVYHVILRLTQGSALPDQPEGINRIHKMLLVS